MSNDIARNIVPVNSIRLLVLDEAHRALGNHSYCQVNECICAPAFVTSDFRLQTSYCQIVREVKRTGSFCRLVALSATPGSDVGNTGKVLENLVSFSELTVCLDPLVQSPTPRAR